VPNYLGVDYGTKRIGLAWADELGIALPIGAIAGVECKGYLVELRQEIQQRQIDHLVVGYPLHMDGKVGKRAKEVDLFIGCLEKTFSLPVHRVDERLTPLAVVEVIGKKAKTKKGKESGKVDAAAACLILKDFLSSGTEEGTLTFS